MIDAFVLLAPILLLGVVALLGLAGCSFHTAVASPTITGPLSPSEGSSAGGDSVTIAGTNFASGDTVTFGGTAATTVSVSGSQSIVAVTPPHSPGVVDVVVTDTAGYGITASQAFTYNGVTHVATSANNSTGVKNLTVGPLQGAVVVVTVVWHGNVTFSFPSPPVPLTLINQTDLPMGTTPIHVAVYFATNVSSPVSITGSLGGTPQEFALVGSAYNFANPNQTFSSDPFNSQQGGGTAASVPLQIADLLAGDLIYAVALARNVNGGLEGTVSAGPNFTARAVSNPTAYLLVEDHMVSANETSPPFNATANTTDSAGSWYIFAMRVRAGTLRT